MSALSEAQDPLHAVELVAEYYAKGGRGASAQRSSSEQNDRGSYSDSVDIGMGASPDASVELQKRYDRAYEMYDTSAVLDVMAEADRKGVLLKERT